MWEQEKVHLKIFEDLMKGRRVRPTVFMPLWNMAGFVLGVCVCVCHVERMDTNK